MRGPAVPPHLSPASPFGTLIHAAAAASASAYVDVDTVPVNAKPPRHRPTPDLASSWQQGSWGLTVLKLPAADPPPRIRTASSRPRLDSSTSAVRRVRQRSTGSPLRGGTNLSAGSDSATSLGNLKPPIRLGLCPRMCSYALQFPQGRPIWNRSDGCEEASRNLWTGDVDQLRIAILRETTRGVVKALGQLGRAMPETKFGTALASVAATTLNRRWRRYDTMSIESGWMIGALAW